jgi:hypothetical protein
MINVINEPCDDHKNAQKRNPVRNHWEIHGEDTRHGIKMYNMHLRNFKTSKIKNMRRHKNK